MDSIKKNKEDIKMNNYDEVLDDVIKQELETIKEMEEGTDEYKVTVDGVTKLMDKSIEMRKLANEKEQKEADRFHEQVLKQQQLADERKDRLVKNVITVVTFASGIVVTIWGTLKSLKFEETGTVTSTAGRKFIGSLFQKK